MESLFLQRSLSVLALPIELILVWRGWRSGMFRSAPFLGVYLSWQLTADVITITCMGWLSLQAWVVAYTITTPIRWLLLMLCIMELYDKAFGLYPGVRRTSRLILLWSAVVITLVACVLILAGQKTEFDPRQWLNSWLTLVQGSFRMVHASLLWVLVAMIAWFRVATTASYRCLVFSLLWNNVLQAVIVFLRYHYGTGSYPAMNLATTAIYDVAILMWLWAVFQWRPDESPSVLFPARADGQQLALARLESLNASLMRAFRQ